MWSDMFADGFRWSGKVKNSGRVIVFMVKDAVVGIQRL